MRYVLPLLLLPEMPLNEIVFVKINVHNKAGKAKNNKHKMGQEQQQQRHQRRQQTRHRHHHGVKWMGVMVRFWIWYCGFWWPHVRDRFWWNFRLLLLGWVSNAGWTGYIIARVARLKGDPWENDVFPKANWASGIFSAMTLWLTQNGKTKWCRN